MKITLIFKKAKMISILVMDHINNNLNYNLKIYKSKT